MLKTTMIAVETILFIFPFLNIDRPNRVGQQTHTD
jgi:hypothetical protein